MKSKTFKVLSEIIFGLFIALIIAIICVLTVGKINNRPVFFLGHSAAFVVSESMEPTIEKQSYVLIEKVEVKDIKTGDVIMFYSDDPQLHGNINTHRVIDIIENGTQFVTMGDNNPVCDNYTAKADKVIGRFVSDLPILTQLFRFFLTTTGLITVAVIILGSVTLVCLPEFTKLAARKKSKLSEEEKQKLIALEVERLKKEKQDEAEKAEGEENV